MTHRTISARATESAGENRDASAAKSAVATPAENWIVQQEFEDDEAVNRETGGSERERRRSLWMD